MAMIMSNSSEVNLTLNQLYIKFPFSGKIIGEKKKNNYLKMTELM